MRKYNIRLASKGLAYLLVLLSLWGGVTALIIASFKSFHFYYLLGILVLGLLSYIALKDVTEISAELGLWQKPRCACCGKTNKPLQIYKSQFGGQEWKYCDDCYSKGIEPYVAMVCYYALTGVTYYLLPHVEKEKIVHQCYLHGVPLKRFITDMDMTGAYAISAATSKENK